MPRLLLGRLIANIGTMFDTGRLMELRNPSLIELIALLALLVVSLIGLSQVAPAISRVTSPVIIGD